MCYCGNMGVGRTPNKNQHTKLTLKKRARGDFWQEKDGRLALTVTPAITLTPVISSYESDTMGVCGKVGTLIRTYKRV